MHVTAVVRSCFATSSNQECAAFSSTTSCLDDLGSCPHCQHGWLLQLCSCWCSRHLQDRLQSVLNSAARLVYSARRSEHIAIAPRAPLVKSYRADQISAVRIHTGLTLPSWYGDVLPRWEPSLRCADTAALVVLAYLLITQRLAIGPSQWLRLVQRAWNSLPSEMHHRWCRSASAWRLFCSDRPFVSNYCTVPL